MISLEEFNAEEKAALDREILDAMQEQEHLCEEVVKRVAAGTATVDDAKFLVDMLGLSLKL